MGPRWARRPEEGSPQESAGVPANTRERAKKKANRDRLALGYWWSWGDSNPRPQAFFAQFYMCSRLIGSRLTSRAATRCKPSQQP